VANWVFYFAIVKDNMLGASQMRVRAGALVGVLSNMLHRK
jgi:hypothetical protein